MMGFKTEERLLLGSVVGYLCKDEKWAASSARCLAPPCSLACYMLLSVPLLTAPRALVFNASFPGTRNSHRALGPSNLPGHSWKLQHLELPVEVQCASPATAVRLPF